MAAMADRLVRTPVAGKPKLLDQVRDVIRRKHYSIRTEQAYIDWIKRFIIYHGKRHPGEMAEEEVAEFLTHLARDLNVAASTQNQALSALLFLYKEVLKHEIGWLEKVERAKKPPKLPVVLSHTEVKRIFAHMHGVPKLMAGLLYGSGLRLMECVRLRVKDVDFELAQITVRDAKGGKDHLTMLPVNLSEPLRRHLVRVKAQHEQDVEDGFGRVHLPLRYVESCRTRNANGFGNMFFLRREFRSIRALEENNGITWPKVSCRAHPREKWPWRESSNVPIATVCAIP